MLVMDGATCASYAASNCPNHPKKREEEDKLAELEGNAAQIVPVPKELGLSQGDMGRYHLNIKEYDAAGRATDFAIAISMDDPKWGPRLQMAAILKQSTIWRGETFPTIIFAVMYAENLGLDIVAGDVYPLQGRIATTNKAKIKRALASGQIEGIEQSTVELPSTFVTKAGPKPDMECTVTIHIKGWKKPIVRKAKLSRWYKEVNPNWRDNPEHMLELNTTAHACEYVTPGGTEGDELPGPLPLPLGGLGTPDADITAKLRESLYKLKLSHQGKKE